jgi:hypothetical protein
VLKNRINDGDDSADRQSAAAPPSRAAASPSNGRGPAAGQR